MFSTTPELVVKIRFLFKYTNSTFCCKKKCRSVFFFLFEIKDFLKKLFVFCLPRLFTRRVTETSEFFLCLVCGFFWRGRGSNLKVLRFYLLTMEVSDFFRLFSNFFRNVKAKLSFILLLSLNFSILATFVSFCKNFVSRFPIFMFFLSFSCFFY